MSETTFKGYVKLNEDFFTDIGIFTLTATADNLVTDEQQDQASLKVDYRLANLRVTSDDYDVIPGTIVTLTITMDPANDYYLKIDWNDGGITNDFHKLTLSGAELEYSHTFVDIKPHTVTVTIRNAINELSEQVNVIVQGPARYLQLDCDNPVAIPLNAATTLECRITHEATKETACVDSVDSAEFFCGLDSTTYEVIGQTDARCDTVTCTSVSCPSTGSAVCGPPVDCNYPTDPAYTVDWNDDSTPADLTALTVANVINKTHTDSHDYTEYGTYTITVSVSNKVSNQTMTFEVDLDQLILEAHARAQAKEIWDEGRPYCVQVDAEVDVHATLTWGSRYNTTWSWQDGTDDTVKSFNESSDTMIATHTYTAPGDYEVVVSFSNLVDQDVQYTLVNENEKLVVEDAPRGLMLICTPQTLLTPDTSPPFTAQTECDIYHNSSFPPPTDAFYEVDFGNGNTISKTVLEIKSDQDKDDDTHTFIHPFMNILGYKRGGTYTVKVHVWNCVGEQNLAFEVNIYEKIFNMDKDPYIHEIISPNTTTVIPGYEENEYFPIENAVAFRVSMDRGSHITYNWDFGDAKGAVTESSFITHKYDEPGTYTVSLRAENRMDTVTLSRPITIQRSIDPAFEFFTDTPNYPKNRTFNFYFGTGNSATDACYCTNFQDTTGLQPIQYAAGNMDQCDKTCPGGGTRIPITAEDLAVNPWIHTQFHFMTKGIYALEFKAANKVSTVTGTYEVIVTKGPCFKPEVKVGTNPENICIPEVNCNTNNQKQFKRAERIKINAKVKTNCESTKDHTYTWTFEKQAVSGEWTSTTFPVDRTVDATWLDSIVDGNKVWKTCTYPEKMIRVEIPSKKLDYGIYRVSHHLTFKVLVATIDAQWEGMGDVGSVRYEPALLPPCPTIRFLSYSKQ